MPGLRGLDPRKKHRALFRVFLSGPEWVLAAQWGRIRPNWGRTPGCSLSSPLPSSSGRIFDETRAVVKTSDNPETRS